MTDHPTPDDQRRELEQLVAAKLMEIAAQAGADHRQEARRRASRMIGKPAATKRTRALIDAERVLAKTPHPGDSPIGIEDPEYLEPLRRWQSAARRVMQLRREVEDAILPRRSL